MAILEIHRVEKVKGNVRITDYLPGKLTSIKSKKGIKKAIGKERILLNDTPVSTAHYVREGDEFVLLEARDRQVYKIKLDVVYEDEYIAVINKPAGIPVSENTFRTIENALPFNLNVSEQDDAYKYPRPVHRLDMKTRGLLLVAKTRTSHILLSRQFSERLVDKAYIALVYNTTPRKWSNNTPIEGKEAITEFETIESVNTAAGSLSLIKAKPITGRTHQIRIHLSESGHPIVGDTVHGDQEKTLKGKGLFLCACEIAFTHPMTSEITKLSIPVPYKFTRRLERLST